jgi:hypothetical protein
VTINEKFPLQGSSKETFSDLSSIGIEKFFLGRAREFKFKKF